MRLSTAESSRSTPMRSSRWTSRPRWRACPECSSGHPLGGRSRMSTATGRPMSPRSTFSSASGRAGLPLARFRSRSDTACGLSTSATRAGTAASPHCSGSSSSREPASTSVLEAVAESPGERRELYRSSTATDPVSLQRTRNPVYWKSARFVLRRLEDLLAGRWNPKRQPADPRQRQGRTRAVECRCGPAYGQGRCEDHGVVGFAAPPFAANGSLAFGGDGRTPSRTRIPPPGKW